MCKACFHLHPLRLVVATAKFSDLSIIMVQCIGGIIILVQYTLAINNAAVIVACLYCGGCT